MRKERFTHISSTMQEVFEERFGENLLITGVPTGFSKIDTMTAGLQPSDFIILASRPSMGKTSFAMNIAHYAALAKNTGVAVFSLEMSKEQLMLRFLSSVGQIDSQRIRTGKLQKEDWRKLTQTFGTLSKAPIFIDDTPAISMHEMRAKVRRLATDHKIGLIIVDYLQLMTGKSSENRTHQISEISQSLKVLAEEQGVPVMALSQLSRSLESRTDKRPIRSDLCESCTVWKDADTVIFLYRDEVYNKAEDNPNIGTAEIIIVKQRNGPTGMVRLKFIKEILVFENMS